MPANVYLSVTPAITAVGLSGNVNGSTFAEVDSHGGFGMKFAVGKEWWVSDHWGLGLAAGQTRQRGPPSEGASPSARPTN